MQKRGTQVIDLEGIAHHRGSAFGHLGLAPQPSSEQFENEISRKKSNFHKRDIFVTL
jgi:tRNA 2-selenouridine synthase